LTGKREKCEIHHGIPGKNVRFITEFPIHSRIGNTVSRVNRAERVIILKRTAMNKLLEWKESASRMPLVLRGVRQVGKT